jgi:hypothetical protein
MGKVKLYGKRRRITKLRYYDDEAAKRRLTGRHEFGYDIDAGRHLSSLGTGKATLSREGST